MTEKNLKIEQKECSKLKIEVDKLKRERETLSEISNNLKGRIRILEDKLLIDSKNREGIDPKEILRENENLH